MIKVYLDWNVMASLKNAQFRRLREIVFDNDKLFLPFSTAHIGDILSSYDGSDERQKLIDSDLDLITSLTGNLCIFNEGKQIVVDYYDPKELFQQRINERYLTEDLTLKGLEKLLTRNEPSPGAGKAVLNDMISPTLETELKALLEKPGLTEHLEKIFPGILDNPTLEGLFNGMFKMFTNLNNGEGYKDLRQLVQTGTGINRDQIFDSKDPFKIIDEKKIERSKPDNSNNSYAGPDWFSEITNEYIELDMHGYQEDKVSVKSGRKQTFNNTTQDSFHVAFASCCNFYITNDDRSYKKAKKVYEKLGKNTLVMKPKEFIEYYQSFFDLKDDKINLKLLSEILINGQSVYSEENGIGMKTFIFPYFLFNSFNRVVIVTGDEEKSTVLLSQNAPTHHFFHIVELQKLVSILNAVLGADLDGLGDLKLSELVNGSWNGRQWKLENMTWKLVKTESYIQLYLILG